MKRIQLFLLSIIVSLLANAQADITSQWTWIKGGSLTNQYAVYGTQGVAGFANNPGSRRGTLTWTDANGKFWLFGGIGFATTNTSDFLDDLWKYDPGTDEWTWVKGTNSSNQNGIYGVQGVAADTIRPGARGFGVTWVDAAGKFWLFGGRGYPASGAINRLNDLWKYDPLTNQWTWIKGTNITEAPGVYGVQGTEATSNTPGARSASVSWTDENGYLWLFGGTGHASGISAGSLNDIWRYNPITNQWAWLKGDNATTKNGIYGTQGIPAPTNNPGGRLSTICWKDDSGKVWIFGGIGNDISHSISDEMNDLWKYDPASNQWTWIKGSNLSGQPSVYGVMGTASAANIPGARSGGARWKDNDGNLWMLGGYDFESNDFSRYYNDLWMYKPAFNEWAWIKGDTVKSQRGAYGIMGVPNNNNKPGARFDAYTWTDTAGNFWLMGGMDSTSGPTYFLLNDLWKFGPEPVNLLCNNGSATFYSNLSGSSYQWQISTDSIYFTNISDNINYSGTATAVLQLINLPASWYGYRFRCNVNGHFSNISTLRFKNSWMGAVNSSWENAANWSCNSLPNVNTDVFINSGNIIISSNVTVRSLYTGAAAVVTVNSGNTLTILH